MEYCWSDHCTREINTPPHKRTKGKKLRYLIVIVVSSWVGILLLQLEYTWKNRRAGAYSVGVGVLASESDVRLFPQNVTVSHKDSTVTYPRARDDRDDISTAKQRTVSHFDDNEEKVKNDTIKPITTDNLNTTQNRTSTNPELCVHRDMPENSMSDKLTMKDDQDDGDDLQERSAMNKYLKDYTYHCLEHFRPDDVVGNENASDCLPVCPCHSTKQVGRTTLNFTTLLNDTKAKHSLAEVSLGGIYRPRDCLARHRVAIIVPFRDREHHLSLFLAYMHPFLQRQQIQYRFFVVEQVSPDVFNKGSMMNIGFLEANTTGSFDCYIFHDVDMFPEDDRHTYTCYKSPRHLGAYLRNWNYTMLYDTLYGGATAFTGAEYEKVNGYSNTFYGWGGEDDDMGNRLKAKRMHFERLSSAVARYTMIKHDFDKRNPYNEYSINGYEFRPEEYPRDGLSSVNYTIEARELHPLHTRIYAKVPPPADGSVKLKDLLAV